MEKEYIKPNIQVIELESITPVAYSTIVGDDPNPDHVGQYWDGLKWVDDELPNGSSEYRNNLWN